MDVFYNTNTAAKYVGVGLRVIQNRLEPDAVQVAGTAEQPLFLRETLDEHGDALREASGQIGRPVGGRIAHKLVGRRPNGKPIIQVVPDSVVDAPIPPVDDTEILYRLLLKFSDDEGRVAEDVPALIAKSMGAEVAQSAAMALLNSGRLTVDMSSRAWTVTK